MEMDIDVDVDANDQMEKYLLHKLNEIKFATKSLQLDYDKKQRVIKECGTRLKNSACQNKLEVVGSWKKIFNGDAVLAFELRSLDKSCISNINIVLTWSSKQHLEYTTKLMAKRKETVEQREFVHPNKAVQEFLEIAKASPNIKKSQPADHEWCEADKITDSGATFLIKLNLPSFAKQRSYDFEAILTYVYAGENGQASLEPFSFGVEDLQRREFSVRGTEILLGNDEAFLTAVFVLERTDLDVTFLDENEQIFESYLQIHCMLDSVSVTSSSKWFYANNLGEVLSGAMIQLAPYEGGKVQRVNLYTRDDTQLYAMLHHLHSHIHGMEVQVHRPENAMFNRKVLEHSAAFSDNTQHRQQPLLLSQAFFTAPSSDPTQQDANLLGECLEEQIALAEKVCSESGKEDDKGDVIDFAKNAKEYSKFRSDLADLEKNTDLLLAAIALKSPGDNGDD